MKKIYAKPVFLKKGRLSAVTASNGASIIINGAA
ncbi:putative RiPP precursor [Mesorhizobium sp. M7A.F.Ca.US.006.01.1.1]|nr:putative RiPP precursor [Mesorhizobium sp. M7A.F.Ca.US.006.01.1.1]RUZ80196.1 putative RiPP precursor [Mesorhizobium sp. M7A.F.Ca.US.006.01.1.1]